MIKQTRRRFLLRTSASVATASVLSLTAACAQPASSATQPASAVSTAQSASTTPKPDVPLNGPIVAYVPDLSSDQITLLVGAQEFVYRDSDLVARLARAIH
jgi:hypothetical protein